MMSATGLTFRPLTEETAEDFRRLVSARFSPEETAIVNRMLANPLRRKVSESGDLAYDAAGKVVYALGMLSRRVYWGTRSLLGETTTTMVAAKGSPREHLNDFILYSLMARGAVFMFANTANEQSARRLRQTVGARPGPDSCSAMRLRVLRQEPCWLVRKADAVFRRLRLKTGAFEVPQVEETVRETASGNCRRLLKIDSRFDDFWTSYLSENHGLVMSRTAEELQWMFADGMAAGDMVLLGLCLPDGALRGYAFLRRNDRRSLCWQVDDLIVRGNDRSGIRALLEGAEAFLLLRTPARALKITGFPDFVQSLFREYFPEEIPNGLNRSLWAAFDPSLAAEVGDWTKSAEGWFGCPYDGDMCLC